MDATTSNFESSAFLQTARVTTPYLFRIGGRRKTSPITLSTTTTTTTTRPTTTKIRPNSLLIRRRFTTKAPEVTTTTQATTRKRPTLNRYRFVSRRPYFKATTTPKTTNIIDDQMNESTNQEIDETTKLANLADILQEIQQAPIPTKIPIQITTHTPRTRLPPIRASTPPPPLLTTKRKLILSTTLAPTTKTFERINPLIYNYYNDQAGVLDTIPQNSKVLLHGNGVIECLDQGNFPHPISCKKFISCAKMENGKVLGWEYTCPKDLSFDPIGGICNWSADVGCNE